MRCDTTAMKFTSCFVDLLFAFAKGDSILFESWISMVGPEERKEWDGCKMDGWLAELNGIRTTLHLEVR